MKKFILLIGIMLSLSGSYAFGFQLAPFVNDPNTITHWSGKMLRYYAMLLSNAAGERSIIKSADTYYDTEGSWGQDYKDMWGLHSINAPSAWGLATGEDVIIAVIDTGVDYNHPDINDNIWLNYNELNGIAGVDDDGNGLVDDIKGWDWYYNDNDPIDDYGHGTHVAGIAAAEGDNNEGIIGIAHNAKIMALKVFNYWGWGVASDVAKAVRYAADMGARVINCSFGMAYSQLLIDAFQYAYSKGCIIVGAAGNEDDVITDYPAKLDYTIAVGALSDDDSVADFSNYGSGLDVVAPGSDILSLRAEGCFGEEEDEYFVPAGDPNAMYMRMDGTSMSAAYVSGLAALMISQDPDITYADIMRRLKFSSVDYFTEGWDIYYGYGKIDAFKALSYDWYEGGEVKTWWFEDTSYDGVTRFDYYLSGDIYSKSYSLADVNNVLRYTYYEGKEKPNLSKFNPPCLTGKINANGADDLIVDFGDEYGIWTRYDSGSWTKLHHLSSKQIRAADLDGNGQDDIIVDFGNVYGIWVKYNDSDWELFHNLSARSITAADMDGSGKEDVIVDFEGYGIWVRYDNSRWEKLHDLSAVNIITADLDGNGEGDVIIDFGSEYGVWAKYNNSYWQSIHSYSPSILASGDLDGNGTDDLVVDFGEVYGVWVRYNNGIWNKLHNAPCENIAVADTDGNGLDDVILDFADPSYGVWVWENNSEWAFFHNESPQFIVTGDMDNDGKSDVITDFGRQYGLWENISSSGWNKINNESPWGANFVSLQESRTLSAPDSAGIIYYHYENEPWAGVSGEGRVDAAIRETPDDNGALGYKYYYFEGTNTVSKIEYYGNADYKDPSNPVLSNMLGGYGSNMSSLTDKDPDAPDQENNQGISSEYSQDSRENMEKIGILSENLMKYPKDLFTQLVSGDLSKAADRIK